MEIEHLRNAETYSSQMNRDLHNMDQMDVGVFEDIQVSAFLLAMSPSIPSGGGSAMMWAGIRLGAHMVLHIENRGTFTAEKYTAHIFQEYEVLFMPFIGVHFLLLPSHTTPHQNR